MTEVLFFQLKPGTEGNGVGEAKSNFDGDGKFELPVKEGDTLVIISEKGCPQRKWLVKNSEGHCMCYYVELLCVLLIVTVKIIIASAWYSRIVLLTANGMPHLFPTFKFNFNIAARV